MTKNSTNRSSLLKIENLSVEYRTDDAVFNAVNNISFEVGKGETFGIVGETGAGKTTLALSIMGLLPKQTGFVTGGKIFTHEKDVNTLSNLEMRALRGSRFSMIFQDPMTSLNPLMTVGDQIAEVLLAHNKISKKECSNRVDEMLNLVGIPAERKVEYPHQFSGGMKQRVVIAMALACEPELIIADEPTTALDVTIQAQVLAMMDELKTKLDTSMIMITHDLGVIALTCDNVAVMYAGEIIEKGTVEDIYENEKHHPYTVGLFGSIPDLTKQTKRLNPIEGLMPDSGELPDGCKFNERCPYAEKICKEMDPLYYVDGTHSIKCHLYTGEIRQILNKEQIIYE